MRASSELLKQEGIGVLKGGLVTLSLLTAVHLGVNTVKAIELENDINRPEKLAEYNRHSQELADTTSKLLREGGEATLLLIAMGAVAFDLSRNRRSKPKAQPVESPVFYELPDENRKLRPLHHYHWSTNRSNTTFIPNDIVSKKYTPIGGDFGGIIKPPVFTTSSRSDIKAKFIAVK